MKTIYAVFALALAVSATGRGAAQNTLVPGFTGFVTGPDVVSMRWSPGGGYLLATSVESRNWDFDRAGPTAVSLSLWNQAKRESKRILTTHDGRVEVNWLPRTNDAVVLIPSSDAETPAEIWRVDARRGSTTRVQGVTGNVELSVSPTQPWAIVYGGGDGGAFVRSLSAAGVLGPRVSLNQSEPLLLGWTQDGNSAIFYGRNDAVEMPASAPPLAPGEIPPYIAIDLLFTPSRNLLEETTKYTRRYEEPPDNAPFAVLTTEVPSAGSSTKTPSDFAPPLHPLWLEQEGDAFYRRVLITGDADAFAMSPRHDAVAYHNEAGAFVVPLISVPTATLKEEQRKAEISYLLNDSKQVILALIQWAQDNGQSSPPSGSDLGALIGSNLKDPSILDGSGGFHYTFGGGRINEVENPAQTEVGYYNGPGGRAVAYLDGHVQWVP